MLPVTAWKGEHWKIIPASCHGTIKYLIYFFIHKKKGILNKKKCKKEPLHKFQNNLTGNFKSITIIIKV